MAVNHLEDLADQWALIHVSFAMSLIDGGEAERTLQALNALGDAQETLHQMALAQDARR